jgi:hypothetical protein
MLSIFGIYRGMCFSSFDANDLYHRLGTSHYSQYLGILGNWTGIAVSTSSWIWFNNDRFIQWPDSFSFCFCDTISCK